jgi:hypothetical protein
MDQIAISIDNSIFPVSTSNGQWHRIPHDAQVEYYIPWTGGGVIYESFVMQMSPAEMGSIPPTSTLFGAIRQHP